MTRVDFIPDELFYTKMSGALKEIEDLKNRQFVGPDSLRPQIVQTDKTYDMAAELDVFNIPNQWSLFTTVIFTADHMLNPYAGLFVDFFDMNGNPYDLAAMNFLDVGRVLFPGTADLFNQDDGEVRVGIFAQSESASYPQFQIKIRVQAPDTGTIDYTTEKQTGIIL